MLEGKLRKFADEFADADALENTMDRRVAQLEALSKMQRHIRQNYVLRSQYEAILDEVAVLSQDFLEAAKEKGYKHVPF